MGGCRIIKDMNATRIEGSDRRLILFVLLVVALSLFVIRANYSAAFPQASIDLKYSRDEITTRAEAFLKTRGLHPERFRNLTLFDADDDARLYLERELGLEEANRLMAGPVSVWRWRARWFQPPNKEELVAYISPAGRLVGFEHTVREDLPGARLSMDAARSIAEKFLTEQTGVAQRLVEEQLRERPKRFDYVFTWEQEGFRAKDATYRRRVVVQGDQIGNYRRVPARARSVAAQFSGAAFEKYALRTLRGKPVFSSRARGTGNGVPGYTPRQFDTGNPSC